MAFTTNRLFSIVIITSNYPTSAQPQNGAFVQQIVRALALKRLKCHVIKPTSIFDRRYGKLDERLSLDLSVKENQITVLKPKYLSTSSKKILFFNTFRVTQSNYRRSVSRELRKINPQPDILYGHFLYPSGAVVNQLGKKLGIPSIAAVGESSFDLIDNHIGVEKSRRDFEGICGILSVSRRNTEYCREVLHIPPEKILTIPNGVDRTLFYPRDRFEMRKKIGLPLNMTIIAFCGHFIERKGPQNLLRAVERLENIGVVLLGNGALKLESDRILFKGVVKHSKVPEWLSASDMFVLPTLTEGSCNSIIEAMACGIPVISSVGDFNDNILNDKVALRINPTNTGAIREAIIKLSSDEELRKRMSEAALKQSKKFDINERADTIFNWMIEIKQKLKHNTI